MDMTFHLWIWSPASSRILYFFLAGVSDDSLLCSLFHTTHSTRDLLSPEVWSGPQFLNFSLHLFPGTLSAALYAWRKAECEDRRK